MAASCSCRWWASTASRKTRAIARHPRRDCVSAPPPHRGPHQTAFEDGSCDRLAAVSTSARPIRRSVSSKTASRGWCAWKTARSTMPSAVFFNFEDGRTHFGRRAIADYTENVEGRLLRALKSVLGTSLIHEKTRIKAHSIAFSDIIGSFLHFLKEKLEERSRPAGRQHRARASGAFRRRRRGSRPAGAERAGEGRPQARLQEYRLPVRADRGSARLRAERGKRRTGADRRHRRRHLGLFHRARVAGARRRR